MSRKSIIASDVIHLTVKTLHSFYNRDISETLHLLSDDFTWIGAFDFQFAQNKQEFLDIISQELNSSSFKVMEETYQLITHYRDFYVVTARLKLISTMPNGAVIHTHTRLTVIWHYVNDMLTLTHIHGSNAQDIPLTASLRSYEYDKTTEFFQYIQSVNAKKEDKLSFKNDDGSYIFLLASELLYLKADGQFTYVHTLKNTIHIMGILGSQSEKLPQNFYRMHKSYIVNLDCVTQISRYKATLINKEVLPIGKEAYLPFKHALME